MVSIETPHVALAAEREESPFRAGSTEPPARLHSVDDMPLLGDDGRPVPVKLSILMAAYNEERTIMRVVHGILSTRFPCEVELIVVDDGSVDATPDLLKEVDDPRVIVHRHVKNSGKGASIMTAASLATGTHIIPFDADMEYAPEDIADMSPHPLFLGQRLRAISQNSGQAHDSKHHKEPEDRPPVEIGQEHASK